MASSLRYDSPAIEKIIPYNADYEFPTRSTKATKLMPRLQPTAPAGNTAFPGNVVKFTFPAQGFLDARKSTISFDLYLKGYDNYTDFNASPAPNAKHYAYLQNNIASIFKHVRINYGSYDLEMVQENGYLQRQLAEFNGYGAHDAAHQSVAKGLGGIHTAGITPVLQRMLAHSIREDTGAKPRPSAVAVGNQYYAVRRYQIELPFGLMQSQKLIPLYYMAAQLQMELTLCNPTDIIMANSNTGGVVSPNTVGTPDFYIKDIYLHPEILDFTESYTARFLTGLQTTGIPIQYSTFKFTSAPLVGSNMQITISEKSRSVKAAFSFIRKQTTSFTEDAGASFGDFDGNTLIEYQYRAGGMYYPATPCKCTHIDGKRTGSAEPFIELQKALKTLSDVEAVSAISADRWNIPVTTNTAFPTFSSNWAAADGKILWDNFNANGFFSGGTQTKFEGIAAGGPLSSVFCMAASFETSNGKEMSGLNAEEKADITLALKFSTAPPAGYEVVTYTLVEKILVLRENNYVDVIE